MTIDEATKIFGKIKEYMGDLQQLSTVWPKLCLDGYFTADELEAIAILMRAALSAAV